MNDNGKDERLIERSGPKVLQQIVISLIEVNPGVTATNVTINCPDEIACRGLFDKGRVVLDQHWARQNAPKVSAVPPGAGQNFLKHLRG